MKSLLQLWEVTLHESGSECHVSTTKDMETCLRRVEYEGISFLTISLPAFCKDFEKSLDIGQVDRHLFQGFSWKGGLPRFLGGFLDRVFDRCTGALLDRPCVDAIRAIRQLTLMFGKVGLRCSQAREAKALRSYVECEKEVRESDASRRDVDVLAFTRMSRLLWSDVLAHVDLQVHRHHLLPKHGPGATADRLRGNAKFRLTEWPQRLEDVFPSGEYIIPNWRYRTDLDHIHFLEPRDERPVKVILVPKTLKTPRIIAVEPTAMQYMQQALLRDLVGAIQSSELSRFGWLLGFCDQTPNRRMAREGSSNGSLATLDLSEASDRVSNQLVRTMLAPHTWLSQGVDACRSRKADVPGHGVVRLAKFASMGSALTFPIEAMVFSTIVLIGIERARGHRLTPRDVQFLRGRVRVYGDDIIVPTDYAVHVIQALEDFGLRVNKDKSFWTGRFRESCGKEYYNGEDVSIVRVRATLPASRGDVQEVIAATSLRNRLYMAGMWQSAAHMDRLLERILRFFPTVDPHTSGLGRWSLLEYEFHKLHRDLQIPLVRGWKIVAKPPKSVLDGSQALLKCLLSASYRDHEPISAVPVEYLWPPHGQTHPDRPSRPFDKDNDGVSSSLKTSDFDEMDDVRKDVIMTMLHGVEPAPVSDHLARLGRPKRVDMKLGWFTPCSRRGGTWPNL